MKIEQRRHGAVLVLRPEGPLAGEDVLAFTSSLRAGMEASLGRLVIDASAIPYVDSAGLLALVEAGEEVGSGGRSLKLCGACDTMRETFELTEVSDLFEFYDDASMAVRSFL
ncbi:MAG: STAS domain-containing protein [Phycisphaeraceae bacterium]|nr:STAS domain-containing protein [Phycisphaeraceae bacterium]MCW5764001.1 STAS domain-containing protein [Phycisphaeraceae bacterium]